MRALIVDDSRFIRNFLGGLLQTMQIDYAQAADGQEALDMLVSGQHFDLALVDVNMPVMNGLDLVKTVREQPAFNSMKVMMVTTEAETMVVVKALELGADEFLMKPFSEEGLKEKLELMGILEICKDA
jgi:two-component system chemotaxis response regulator CheY